MARKFALIVGNSEYEDPSLASLVSPGSDVRVLAETLEDAEIGRFDEVLELFNEPEVRVRRSVASLFARKKPDDLLLLYFSTHGILDENGRLFLAARDTQRDLLKATAVSASFITDEMDNSSSRRQVLILDCCHSGAFAHGVKGTPGSSVSTATAFAGNGFGRVVLTATDSTQYAWDGDKLVGRDDVTSSVFTRHLIEGLRTGAADEDDDGRITLDELYEYVYQKVLGENSRQTPGKWSYKQQGNLVIARNPHPGRKLANLPDHLQKAMESDFTSAREGAIRELERYLRGPQAGLSKAAERALNKVVAEDDSRRVQSLAAKVLLDFQIAEEELPESPATQSLHRIQTVLAEPTYGIRPFGVLEIAPSDMAGIMPRQVEPDTPQKDTANGVVELQRFAADDTKPEQVAKADLAKETINGVVEVTQPDAADAGPVKVVKGDTPLQARPRALPQFRSSPKSPRWPRVLAFISGLLMILMLIIAELYKTPVSRPQAPSAPSLKNQLNSYVARICPSCTPILPSKLGRLPANFRTVPMEEIVVFSRVSPHMVAAVCSPNPCGINLVGVGPNSLKRSTESASFVSARFLPAKRERVIVQMDQCDAGECSYAVGVWKNPLAAQ